MAFVKMETDFLATVNKVNESLNIYRAIFVCKDVEETIKLLEAHEFPCASSFEEVSSHRIFVTDCDYLVQCDLEDEDFTVIYVQDLDNLGTVSKLAQHYNIKLIVTL